MLLDKAHRGFEPQGYKEEKDPFPVLELTIQRGRQRGKQEVLGMRNSSSIPAGPGAIMHFYKDNCFKADQGGLDLDKNGLSIVKKPHKQGKRKHR